MEGHKDVLTPVVFSPNGKLLASGSDDTTIKLWDPVSGHELMTLTGHKDFVESLAFSPDGRFLASGSKDSTVRLWEVGSLDTANSSGGTAKSPAQPITEWTVFKGHTEGINSVAFSPDGKTLASASSDHTAKLWDVVRGQEHVTLAVNTGRLFMVAFSPDGRLLAAGGDDNVIRVWDATSRVLRKSLVGHEGRVTDLAFSPDGRQLVSGSWDKTVKIWDLNGGKERATLRGHNSIVHAIAISPDGKLIASGNSNIKIWDAVSGTGKFALHVAKSNYPDTVGLAFSPDSRALASGSSDEIVNIWDMPSGRRRPVLEGHTGYIHTVAFSSDGKLLASADDASIRLWDFASGRSLHTLRGHTAPTVSVAFSPDSRGACVGEQRHDHQTLGCGHGRHLVTLNGHTAVVEAVAFSADGKTLASASSDRTVKLGRRGGDRSRRLGLRPTERRRPQWRFPLSTTRRMRHDQVIFAGVVTISSFACARGNPVACGDDAASPKNVTAAFAGVKAGQVRDDNGLGIKLAWCPPLEFTMGSPASETGRGDDENQVHVRLSRTAFGWDNTKSRRVSGSA